MLVRCPTCNWRYLRHRRSYHVALHDLLPVFPCPVRTDLPQQLHVLQFPLDIVSIILHGLYQLQPERQVCAWDIDKLLINIMVHYLFCMYLTLIFFSYQDPNIHQVCHAAFFGQWLGVEEPPYGLDCAVRLLRDHLATNDFISFRDTICFWIEHFILRRLWYMIFPF